MQPQQKAADCGDSSTAHTQTTPGHSTSTIAALEFLEALAPGHPVTFQTFADSPAKRAGMARVIHADAGEIPADLLTLNESGAGIFVAVNATDGNGRKAENVTAVRALFVDFDTEDNNRPAMLAAVPLPPSAVVESSPGKHHAYWFTDGWPLDQFRDAQATLATFFGSDPKVCDLPRVMRLPGFLHRKRDPFLVRVLSLAGTRYDADTLCDWLATLTPQDAPPARPPEGPPRGAGHEGDRYAARALQLAVGAVMTAHDGGRNDALNREAHGLYGLAKAGRLNEATITDTLTRAAQSAGQEPGEIVTTLRSALNAATPRYEGLPVTTAGGTSPPPQEGDTAARWATVVPLDRMDHTEPPFFWTEEILPAGTVTLLGAHGGVGKTMLALQWSVCVALGLPFMGKHTHPGRVLFYSAEDDGNRVLHRLQKICRHYGIDPHTLKERLRLLDATDIDPALYGEMLDPLAGGRRSKFATTANYDRLREDAEEFEADFVVIDNASDTYDAEENARARVRAFIRSLNVLAKGRSAAVLLLAHVDKHTAKGEAQGREGYSGSTAWHNSVRSRLFLSSKDGALTLEHQKCNLGPQSAPIVMAWSEGVLVSSAHATPQDDAVRGFMLNEYAKDVLRLIHEFTERGEFIAQAHTSPYNARKMLAGQKTFPPEMQRGTAVFDLLRDMERAGHVKREGYRTPDRKDRARWQVTPTGMERAGIAPTAPTAPTPEDGADRQEEERAPSAPTPLGGMGGGARALAGAEDGADHEADPAARHA